MSGVTRLALAIVLLGSCRRAPDEPASPLLDGGLALTRAALAAPAPADAGGPIHDFCEEVYSADSQRQRQDCSQSDADKMQSIARIAASLCARDLSAILASAHATFDSDAAAHCVEMLRSKALARTSETDTLFSHFPCDRVLLGTQAAGGACRFAVECKDGLACVVTPPGLDGVCVASPSSGHACSRQAIGSTLSESAAEAHHPACASGAWCDGRTCQPRLPSGKGCSDGRSPAPPEPGHDLADGVCADGLGCVMGQCAVPHPVGGGCNASSDCAFGLWCAPGTDGGASGGTCREKLAERLLCASPTACKGRCELDKGPDGGTLQRGKCVSVCGSG